MKRPLLFSTIILFLSTVFTDSSAQNITTTTATGSISACAGMVSVSPFIEQVTVSGSGLISNITVTAPAGFEVSLSAAGGYGSTLTIPETGGVVATTPIFVHSAAADPPGYITGNVVLSAAGASTQNIAVSGSVHALPTVNAVPNQTVSNGSPTAATTFTGVAVKYTWVNNTPGIGLGASGSGNIPSFTAINTGSTPVTATITVTPENISSQFAYISSWGVYPENIGIISVINTVSNTVTATITVGTFPNAVCVSPDGSLAYVANDNDHTISVISAITNTVIATFPGGSNPYDLALSPDGSLLYVSNSGSSSISIYNTSTYSRVAIVPVGSYPSGIVVSPDGSKVYVVNQASNSVSVINTATNLVTATIPVGTSPVDVAISPDGSTVYVTNQSSNTVSVISTATNSVVANIPVGLFPVGIAISPDGSRLYVANGNQNSVSVVNTATNTVINTIYVGAGPEGIDVSPDGSQVYVANSSSNTVSVINTSSGLVTATIPVARLPTTFGNFISSGLPCTGTPITFTITVNPTTASILSSPVTGTISACAGTPSASPDIAQFTVSGSDLRDSITVTAPAGFEVSLTSGSTYSASVTISPLAGTVSNIIVYVRSASSAPAGNISGDVVLTSSGAASLSIPVAGTITAPPTVFAIANQTLSNGSTTSTVNFTGTGDTYTWVNNSPGIGLAASGSGNIASFKAINMGQTPVIATITVTPSLTGSICSGVPLSFTLTINPTDSILTGLAAGNIGACAGSASVSPFVQQIYVSGYGLAADITATAPAGFELSLTAGGGYSSSVTVSQVAGIVNSIPLYVRSSPTATAGGISGEVVLSSAGAASQLVEVSGIIQPLLTPSISITASSVTVCAGAPVTFTAVPTNGGASPQYQWLLDNNNAGTDDSIFTSSDLANGDVVSCILTGNPACAARPDAASNSITIHVTPKITSTVVISPSANDVCSGTPITFTATPTNGGPSPSFRWMVNGAPSGATGPNFTSYTLKNGDSVCCIMNSGLACTSPDSSAAVYLLIYPLPTVSFNPDTVYTTNNTGVELSPLIAGTIETYQWSPASGLNNSTIANPVADPSNENTYQLLVTDIDGCAATGKVTVIAGRPLVMPNAFTPYANGHNNVFRIPPGVQFNLEEFDIFDRWGNRVFTTRNISRGWDGNYNGMPADAATYVYMISGKTPSGKPVLLKGTVILIK